MISLITVNFNEMDLTVELIKSIGDYDPSSLEIIVVDNGSKIDETHKLNVFRPEIKIIKSDQNLGFAGGNNLGIKQSKGDYLFFINNDTIFKEKTETIFRLRDVLQNNPNAGVVSPLIYYYEQPETLQYAGYTAHNPITGRNKTTHFRQKLSVSNKTVLTAFPHGAAMMLKKRIIDEVGLMPENYFLYFEELDWAFQIKNKGHQILVDHKSRIFHKESMATGKISGLKTYFLTRNRILFMRRNYNRIEFLLFILFFITVSTPTHIFRCVINGETHNIQPFYKAIKWHLVNGVQSFDIGYLKENLVNN